MSDAAEVRARIAEARNRASEWGHIENAPGDVRLLSDLADALEAAHAEPDEGQRDAHRWLANYHGSIDSTALVLAFRAGRRSARVPVSRDELARFIGQWMADDHAGFGSCNAPRDMASDILAAHDIYPKADRKPGDSKGGRTVNHLDEVRAVAEAIVARTINQIGTHSTDCHEYHLPCFAWFVLNRISADSGEAGQ